VPPPAWFFTTIAVMLGLALFAPGRALVPDPWTLLGLVPIAAGVALNLAAVSAFRRSATTIEPDGTPAALVSDGPYRFTRNPMYLGGVVILLGLAVLLGAASPFLAPPLFAAIAATRFIPPEERKLARTFGHRYMTYRGSVRRWL
jgi:protein-S-isoprenylcysteine O-methyltransferase Ste14